MVGTGCVKTAFKPQHLACAGVVCPALPAAAAGTESSVFPCCLPAVFRLAGVGCETRCPAPEVSRLLSRPCRMGSVADGVTGSPRLPGLPCAKHGAPGSFASIPAEEAAVAWGGSGIPVTAPFRITGLRGNILRPLFLLPWHLRGLCHLLLWPLAVAASLARCAASLFWVAASGSR